MDIDTAYKSIVIEKWKKIYEVIDGDYSPALRALAHAVLRHAVEAEQLLSNLDVENLKDKDRLFFFETKLILAIIKRDFKKVYEIASNLSQTFPGSFFGNARLEMLYKKTKQWEVANQYLNKMLLIFPELKGLQFEAAALALKRKNLADFHLYSKNVKGWPRKVILFFESSTFHKLIFFSVYFGCIFVIGNSNMFFYILCSTFGLWLRFRMDDRLLYQDLTVRMLIAQGVYFIGLILFSIINHLP